MSATGRVLYLRIALIVIGLTFIFGVYPLTIVWPSGWSWGMGHSHYLTMILGVYATLGVFLLIASRDPDAHRSLIWFTVWSSIVHAVVMAVQSFQSGHHMGHLWGDVPALLVDVELSQTARMPKTSLPAGLVVSIEAPCPDNRYPEVPQTSSGLRPKK